MKLLRNSGLIIIILVNLIFAYKYGVRQTFLPLYLLMLLYTFLYAGGIGLIYYLKDKINQYTRFNTLFLIVISIAFVALVFASYAIDGNALNTDRWSALEVSVRSVLNLEYPYDKLDHMGGRSSNFPGLIYIGIPFYLLGNVALLQPFTFLVLMLFVRNYHMENHQKVLFFFLLVSSVAFMWEVFAKSDLMSNVLLVLLFIMWWHKKYPRDYMSKPILLAFLAAFLVLTRGFLAIPLTLFLFGSFLKTNTRRKVQFGSLLIVFMVLLTIPVLVNLPSKEIVMANNPILNQTSYAPSWLMIGILLLPFLIAPFVKRIDSILGWTYVILTALLFGLFLENLILKGIEINIYGNLFDISYLGILVPCAIFFYTFYQTDTNTVTE